MEKNEEVGLIITVGYKKFNSQFYGLNEKIKNALRNSFRLNEIVKLLIEIDLSISNINLCN